MTNTDVIATLAQHGDTAREIPAFSADDIPLDLAIRAHSGTSLVPEQRADQERAAYVAHLESVRDELAKLATTPELQEILAAQLTRYRDGYRRRVLAWLEARSRCVSVLVAGPSGFPAQRAEKANQTERNRRDELLRYSERAIKAIRSTLERAAGNGPISSDDPDAPEALRRRIGELEQRQERMRAVNRILRETTDREERIKQIMALGFDEREAFLRTDQERFGGVGFNSLELANNSANIRRLKARLADLERKRSRPTTEETIGAVRIVQDTEANRLRIFFPAKPSASTIAALKRNGFRWAPSVGAWQRHLSNSALYWAREIAAASA